MVASLFTQNAYFIMGGMALAISGLVHVIIQTRKKTVLSSLNYAIGASRFNNGNYRHAQKSFTKAAKLNPRNELAEYALGKVKYYI
jgi:Flp pilus assembly protein TadD